MLIERHFLFRAVDKMNNELLKNHEEFLLVYDSKLRKFLILKQAFIH